MEVCYSADGRGCTIWIDWIEARDYRDTELFRDTFWRCRDEGLAVSVFIRKK